MTLNQKKQIPVAKPYITQDDIDEVIKVLKSGQLSLGPCTKKFEEAFAKTIGTQCAVAVSSGTAGLHLCMRTINLQPDDEVITSPFSFVASANCVLFEGGKPVFADIDEKTFNINPKKVKEVMSEKTKALLPVHIFGQPCNMDPLVKLAQKEDLEIVEDACEAILAEYNGKKVGTFGKAAVFAFYPNKQMTTGEGGVITTDSKQVYDLCKSMENQGRADDGSWLNHVRLGYNYRMDEMSAALGLSQLRKLDFMIKEREKIAKKYTERLKKVEGIITPYVMPNVRHTWFVYVIQVKEGIDRDRVMAKLKEHGISTKNYLPAIHLQKFYKEKFNYTPGDLPVCEKVSASTIALPLYIGLGDEDIEYICTILEQVIREI